MIRGAMWLLAVVVVTLVAGYLFVRSPQGQRFLDVGPRGPGSGSGIRVVGGSIKVTDRDNWSVEKPDTLHPRTSLEADTADATRFAIEGVSQQRNGKAGIYIYSADPGSTWSIDDLVKDTGRGVRITAHVGATPSNGIVTVVPINDGDVFVPFSGSGSLPNERDYQDNNGPACSPSASPKCDRVDTIAVTIGGVTDTWYCVEPHGYCHIDIGN
jgi:hypothetical protein